MGLFVDLIHLSRHATDAALEGIYKAHHDHGDDDIWKPHESALIRRLVELFTERGLMRLETVRKQYEAWQSGQYHKPGTTPVVPPGMMARWSEAELALARIYLESLPPAKWTIGDHMLAIEFVVQTYLPPEDLVAEADWLATKASLMGKVQANLENAALTPKQADAVLAHLPNASGLVTGLTATQHAALEFASLRAADSVVSLAASVRRRMRAVVRADLEQRAFGNVPAGTSSLQTKLLDEFATLNRDWRRIAITEAGEAQLQGFIASLKPGTKVKRIERYANACSFCKAIHGKVVTVVEPSKDGKHPETEVWPGKNNLGRSASPRKRVGDVLVPREPHEMWWLPAGLAHPHCRGRWELVESVLDDLDDQDFAADLRAILEG